MVILIGLIVSDSFEHFVEDLDDFERSTIFIRNDNFVDQIYENFNVFAYLQKAALTFLVIIL